MRIASQPDTLLSDDHRAVGEVLQQLLKALDSKNVEVSNAKLDLLWARLAVHIRAEHLHLFPAIGSKLGETQSIIDDLRADHDFFMRELARAIAILRGLPKRINRANDEAKLAAVCDTIREIEKRLATHNEIEENHVYHLATTILTQPEQSALATQINAELENHPPRFSVETWDNNR